MGEEGAAEVAEGRGRRRAVHFLDVLFRRCFIMAQLRPARRSYLVVANRGAGGQQTNVMADMKFACSHCGQDIECDELWSGHEIQCPTCQGQLVVPPKPDAPPHASLAAAKPGQARLSIGQSRHQRSAAPTYLSSAARLSPISREKSGVDERLGQRCFRPSYSQKR